ncbi:MAG: hypothetical protein OIF58_11050 [Cohaesibacter sp.]|nr:hypothetical protein [Cohaesibacter sp.]
MADEFELYRSSLESPGWNGEEITPSDSVNLTTTCRAFWVGGAGDVVVEMASGKELTFENAMGWMPIRVKKIKATGTTATGIVGVW